MHFKGLTCRFRTIVEISGCLWTLWMGWQGEWKMENRKWATAAGKSATRLTRPKGQSVSQAPAANLYSILFSNPECKSQVPIISIQVYF